MSRRRVQGSATEGDAASKGAEHEHDDDVLMPDDEHEGELVTSAQPVVPAPSDARGPHVPLGSRAGVRIMFNACERDAAGNVTKPGERTVTEEEAVKLVKLGVATLL